jgi:hypothetical protein
MAGLRMCAAGKMGLVIGAAFWLSGCTDDTAAAAEPLTLTEKTADTGTAAESDTTQDASVADPQVAVIEAALNAPETAFTAADEAAAFGDAKVAGLVGRLAPLSTFSESPDAAGWMADPAEQVPAVSALAGQRDRDVYYVRLTVQGRDDTAMAVDGTLTTSDGAALARRLWDAESGDEFTKRGLLIAKGLTSRSFHLSVSETDTDRLLMVVLADKAPTLTLTVGDVDVPIGLDSRDGDSFDIDGGPRVAATVIKNPRGRCTVTEAVLETEAFTGALGPIAVVRGALRSDGAHVGHLRGFYGHAPASGESVLVFKAISLSGKALSVGVLHGEVGYAPRVGGLRDGAKGIGSFHARGLVESATGTQSVPTVSLGITLYTDCRAK